MADSVDPDPPPPPADGAPQEVVTVHPVTPIPGDAPPPRQGCLAKRSCLEKCLIAIVIIVVIIVLIALVAFLVFYFFFSPPEGRCLSDNCVASASRLKKYMDESKDPCNNFYEYACGNWMEDQVLAPDEGQISFTTTMTDSNNAKIRRLLEKELETSDPTYIQKSKKFYKACMNTDRIEDLGTKPFLDLVDTVGKFPALSPDWNETDFQLEETIANLARITFMPMMKIYIERDLKKSTVNRIIIDDAELSLNSQSNYKKGRENPWLSEYERWLVNALTLLGVDRAQAVTDMKDTIDLEIKIAMLQRDVVEKQEDENARYNPLKIAILKNRYPWLDWLKLLQKIVASVEEDVSGVVLDIEETVIVTEPDFIKKLGELIAETPTRVLANYMMSRLLVFTGALGEDFVDLSEKFQEETQHIQPVPRWETCTGTTTKIFPDFVSRMYVDNFFSPEAKNYVTGMVKNLLGVFKGMIQDNVWMAEQTKKIAIEKVNNMDFKVGYPDDLKDDAKLNNKYKTISATEYHYMKTLVDHRLFLMSENVKSLRKRKNKDEWNIAAATVNAYYDRLANEIILPAAFLQEPAYSPDYPDSMNYGGIGMVVGHEIVHGFDAIGSQYDANGELKDWWTDNDSEKFKDATQCLEDQYGCYKWDGLSINGRLTLSENIADNAGLKTSYKAYDRVIDSRGVEEARLPGLDLSQRQIFFLSFAQIWCTKVRPSLMKHITETDIHTPAPYRVYGTLQNSREFAEAYRCPLDSRMNPGRKCEVW